jgi:hypothetical protein
MKVQIVVEVKVSAFTLREGIARGSGKPYSMREQSAWVDTGKAYPQELRFILRDRPQIQDAVPVGKYVLDESAIYVDKNGSLQINIHSMKPIAAVSAGTVAASRA